MRLNLNMHLEKCWEKWTLNTIKKFKTKLLLPTKHSLQNAFLKAVVYSYSNQIHLATTEFSNERSTTSLRLVIRSSAPILYLSITRKVHPKILRSEQKYQEKLYNADFFNSEFLRKRA